MAHKQHSIKRNYSIPQIVDKYCQDKTHYKQYRCKACPSEKCRLPKELIDSSIMVCAILPEERWAEESRELIEEADTSFQGCVTKEIIGEIISRVWREMCYSTGAFEIERIEDQFMHIMKKCRHFRVIEEQTEENEKLSALIQKECYAIEDTRHIAAAIIEKIEFLTIDKEIIDDTKSIIRCANSYEKGYGDRVKITHVETFLKRKKI